MRSIPRVTHPSRNPRQIAVESRALAKAITWRRFLRRLDRNPHVTLRSQGLREAPVPRLSERELHFIQTDDRLHLNAFHSQEWKALREDTLPTLRVPGKGLWGVLSIRRTSEPAPLPCEPGERIDGPVILHLVKLT
jgi:hypothetical protein